MDPVERLDFNKRHNYSHNDIDDFVSRVDQVSAAMEKIKSGTVEQSDLEAIPGYKSPEQIEAEERAKEKRKAERLRKEEEKKQEEKDAWWSRANLCYGNGLADALVDSTTTAVDDAAEVEVNRIVASYTNRDANDYSQWNNWTPADPVTLEENAVQEKMLEKIKNEEFEKNNPEFCNQFRDDLEKRQESNAKKHSSAMRFKEVGNRHYKRKEYTKAITYYKKAMDLLPHNVSILTNIAQSYLRQSMLDDTLEFCNRALLVNPKHIKALSRRAAVHRAKGNYVDALSDLKYASSVVFDDDGNNTNSDLENELQTVQGEWNDRCAEKKLRDRLEKSSDATEFSNDGMLLRLETLIKFLVEDGESVSSLSPELQNLVENVGLYRAIGVLLNDNSEGKILLRTLGGLSKLVTILKESQNEEANNILELLTIAVTDSTRNQEVLCTVEFLNTLKGVESTAAAVNLLSECSNLKQWREGLLDDKELLSSLLSIMSNVEDSNLTIKCSDLFLLLSSHYKGIERMESLLALLDVMLKVLDVEKKHGLHRVALRESVCSIVSNLSSSGFFRNRVASSTSLQQMTCNVLLKVLRNADTSDSETSKERALAALLNFSLEKSKEGFRQTLSTGAAVPTLLGILKDSGNKLSLVKVRAAALLSRLPIVPLAMKLISDSETALMTLRLVFLQQMEEQDEENLELYFKVKEHVSRIFAALLGSSETAKKVFTSSDTNSKVSAVQQCNIIVSTLLKKDEARTYQVLVANVLKCLIACVDDNDANTAAAFAQDARSIENLVTLLRVLPDSAGGGGGARKNTAVLLAKLCKHESFKKRIEAVDGIKILLSLSRSL